MKKLLYVLAAALCLVACEKNTPSDKSEYVDLGLASETKWKTQNEQNTDDYYFWDYETALSEFGNNLPTKEQWEELKSSCHWEWTGSGYKVTGPNGKSIVLPANGIRYCDGYVDYVGWLGFYWSSTPDGSEEAWLLSFDLEEVDMGADLRCVGRSVRLVR